MTFGGRSTLSLVFTVNLVVQPFGLMLSRPQFGHFLSPRPEGPRGPCRYVTSWKHTHISNELIACKVDATRFPGQMLYADYGFLSHRRLVSLVTSHNHCGLEFIAVDNDTAFAIFCDLSETHSDAHPNLNVFRVNVHYLSRQSRSFVKLNLCHNVWYLTFEVLRCLSYNREGMNLTEALVFVLLELAFPSALGADQSRWEVVCAAVATVCSNEIVD